MTRRVSTILLFTFFAALHARAQCNSSLATSPPTSHVTACGTNAYMQFPTHPNCWAMNPFTHQLYPAPELTNIHTEADVASYRAQLISALWGTAGFPTRSDVTVERNVTSCLLLPTAPAGNGTFCYPFGNAAYSPVPNLQQVDRLTILTPVRSGDFDPVTHQQLSTTAPNTICDFAATYATPNGNVPAVTSVVYFYHPTVSNGRLAIFHHGHAENMADDGGKTTIDALLSQGFSVLAFWMPLLGENERCHVIPVYRGNQCPPSDPTCLNNEMHTDFLHMTVEHGDALSVFLEPVAVAINYAIRNASAFQLATPLDVSMYGISGGGWTTAAYAAVDPRVRTSFPTAGGQPKYVIANTSFTQPQNPNNPSDPLAGMSDFELDFRAANESANPWSPNAIYRVVNSLDLYMLGGAGSGRRSWQVLNQFDDCCFWGVGFKMYLSTLRDLISDPVAFPAGGEFQVYFNQNNDYQNNNAIPPVAGHRIAPVVAKSISYQELYVALYLPAADFDDDHVADPAVFRPPDRNGAGAAWVYLSGGTVTTLTGVTGIQPGDQPVPADYFGDGHAEAAVYRPLTGAWYVRRRNDNTQTAYTTGLPGGTTVAGDIPVPGDYDGDGKADLAIFRPAKGTWYIRRSSDGNVVALSPTNAPWGSFHPSDTPVPAKYNNDGKTQMALYRPSGGGTWYVVNGWSADASFNIVPSQTTVVSSWNAPVSATALPAPSAGDIPVPADYDGDGKADMAFFRPDEAGCVTGSWYVRKSTSPSPMTRLTWGNTMAFAPGDRPIPGAYSVSSSAEPALFRPSTGHWYFSDGRDLQVRSDPMPADLPLGSRTNWSYSTGTMAYASLYPPVDLRATASGTSVSVTWSASESWSVSASEYQLWRSGPSTPGTWTQLSPGTAITSLSYTDSGAVGSTYLYKVKAKVSGTWTDFSNVDLATTTTVTDDNNLSGKLLLTTHVTELYNAVNMLLAAAGLPALPVPSMPTKALAAQVQILRDGVVRAYNAIGMPLPPSFASGSVVANVSGTLAQHFQEIRDAVK
jgi:hypothetical protein